MKRHQKPYGCTFPKCNQLFGSKDDWKRHENTVHAHVACWRCHELESPGYECARLFYRSDLFAKHLREGHFVDQTGILSRLQNYKIGGNGQRRFWCGFCKKLISLECEGPDAWNERFDHIDKNHFKKGTNIADWMPPEGHQTKSDLEKSMEHHKDSAMRNEEPNLGEKYVDGESNVTLSFSGEHDEPSYPEQDPVTGIHISPSRSRSKEFSGAKSARQPNPSSFSNTNATSQDLVSSTSQNVKPNQQEYNSRLENGDVQNLNSTIKSPLAGQSRVIDPSFQPLAPMSGAPFRWGFQTCTCVSGFIFTIYVRPNRKEVHTQSPFALLAVP